MEDKSLTNKLMDLIEFAGDGILLGDEKGYLIMANKKMSSISGYDNHELLGKHISFLFSDDELKNKPFQFEKLKQVGNILTTRNLIDRHGNATPVEMHSSNYDDGYISIIRDLQEKLNNKNQIKDLSLRLDSITKAEKIGIIEYEPITKNITYNEEMCELMASESLGKCQVLDDWISLLHHDDQSRVRESLSSVLEENIAIEIVYRTKTDHHIYKTIKSTVNLLGIKGSSKLKLVISSIDISQTNQLKIKLRQSEDTFRTLTNTTSTAIFIYQDKFLYTNPAFKRITGYSLDEARDLFFWEIIHTDYQELVKTRGKRRLDNEIVAKVYEFKIVTKNGEEKWIAFSADAFNYMGQAAAIGTAYDITAQKTTELELKATISALEKEKKKAQESENNFRVYMEQNSAIMLVIEPKSLDIIFANYAAAKFYGYSRKELTNLKITTLQTLPKDVIKSKMKTALSSESRVFTFTHKKKSGDFVEVNVHPSVVVSNGQKTLVLIVHDITEEIKTKSDLERSHNTYRNILNSISESVYILNKKGEFIFVNETSKKMYGYNKADFIGKTPAFISAPNMNNLEEVGKLIERAYHGETLSFEFWGKRKDESIFPKDVVVSPGYFFGEKIVIAVARNITEQKRINNELVVAKEKAEESDQLKSAFLANMSHEIRTPMNAILGFSELVKDPEMEDEERMRFLNIINKSSYHLLNLINDLVDISKIHAKQMKIYKSKFHLNSVLFELYEYFEGEILNAEKENDVHLVLSCDLSPDQDIITTDETRLRQILQNTIGNAIKFTSKGNIEISYKKTDTEIVFSVKDEGIGISQDKIDQIFERFQQESTTVSKKFGGTGLGLAISKACVNLLGGKIWCESEKGKGTNMQFSFPVE
jgi:PAS domain S-box-containing protein